MREKTIKLYQIGELSAEAKEKARDWYREFVFSDSSDWEFVYDDAVTIAALFGLEIGQRPYKTVGGGTRYEPRIYFSGFSSQGDGACFEGEYQYKPGAMTDVRNHAPKDEKLHAIVDAIQEAQIRMLVHGFSVRASITQQGQYSHSHSMAIDFTAVANDGEEAEIPDEKNSWLQLHEKEIATQLRAFADWIYSQLEAEHDYRSSDESVDENIAANEYEFTEDGRRHI